MAKEIKSKRQALYKEGGVQLTYGVIYELIRSFLKPFIQVSLFIETTPTLYSIAVDTNDDKRYLSLRITCKRKTLGNLTLNATGYFYVAGKNRPQEIILIFEDPPEVLEAGEEVNLKCLTSIDFQNVINPNSKIIIQLTYDYAFTSYIKTVNKTFSWTFDLDDGKLISNQLILNE